ncbi:hypothetical protein HY570_03470 [Candidatus Micrarchaeota archaeon]|nr:hypothetical protein [Candidatus Micrarchaeota archaeon]
MRSVFRVILVFTLFLSTLSAAAASGYFILNVKNADKEPMENVSVKLTYYTGATFTFEKQEKFTTDEAGKVEAFIESLDNKNITVEVSYNDIYVKEVYKWINVAGSPIFITLPVRNLIVEVKDQKFRPVQNIQVVVTDGNKSYVKISDDYGIAKFEGLEDKYDYTVRGIYGICNCRNFTRTGVFWRGALTVTIPTSDLRIVTRDERGNPVSSSVEVVLHALNKTVNVRTSETNGEYTLTQIPLTSITLKARYDYYLPPRTFEIDSDYEQTFIFDLLPPKIGNVEVKPKQPTREDVTITVDVKEENVYSSGISQVYLLYAVDNNSKPPLLMSKIDLDRFATIIPAQKEGSVVTFRIEAVDNVNRSSQSVEYVYNVTNRPRTIAAPTGESLIGAVILIALIIVVGWVGFDFYRARKQQQVKKEEPKKQNK